MTDQRVGDFHGDALIAHARSGTRLLRRTVATLASVAISPLTCVVIPPILDALATFPQRRLSLSDSLQPLHNAQVTVEFDGDRLIAVILPNDGIATPVRILCEAIGLDVETQMDAIRAHPVLSRGLRVVTIMVDQRVRSVAALIHSMIPFWLATVNPQQVNDASRGKLVRYQQDVADVLAHIFYGDTTPDSPPSDPALAQLSQRMYDALREARLARDALVLTQQQLLTQHLQLTQLTDIVRDLEAYIPISPAQAAYLQQAMKHMAQRVIQHRTETSARSERQVYETLFGRFKLEFQLPRYDALPRNRYDEARRWLEHRAAELLPGDADALPPHQETLL